jgi:putative flavoprotein involved in K+ transport
VGENALPRSIETVIVGAGQAGLMMSSLLRDAGREHLLLDARDRLGGGWLDRWDAFRLVSPNWTASFPGAPYDGDDPDGYMPRDEIAGRVARFGERIAAPVELGAHVDRLARDEGGRGFRLSTSRGPISARRVVVATGGFHAARIPDWAGSLSPRVTQLHSSAYRSETQLPPGGVLVVGSGQTGVQIAEELQAAGRQVTLAVGRCGRVPRRYRGSDIFRWLNDVRHHGPRYGAGLPTPATMPDLRMRLACNPHLSGHGGGHETNLRQFATEGMRLTGRLRAIDGERVAFAEDLGESLAFADRFFDERFAPLIEKYIEGAGIDAGPDERVPVEFEPPEVASLDLAAEGISSLLWTTGFRPDYSWIDFPVTDEMGFARTTDGLTDTPGLAFLGALWMRDQGSATLFGVGADAAIVADRLEAAR